MAENLDIRTRIPNKVRRGEIVEVRTLVIAPALADPADGFGPDGVPIRVVRKFLAAFNGQTALDCEAQPGIARNFALTFPLKPPASGLLTLTWLLETGEAVERRVSIEVVD
jgi:sulfur-oxidizing protein SoxZ